MNLVDAGRQRAIDKAYRRFLAEVASAHDVTADSDRAACLAFFFAAGAYQAKLGQSASCLDVLSREIQASIAANRES